MINARSAPSQTFAVQCTYSQDSCTPNFGKTIEWKNQLFPRVQNLRMHKPNTNNCRHTYVAKLVIVCAYCQSVVLLRTCAAVPQCASMEAACGICACMHGLGWQSSATEFARTAMLTASMPTVCSRLTAAVNIRTRAHHLHASTAGG